MPTPTPERARPIFLLLAAGAASISMTQSLLNPVLSTLQQELETTPNAVSWVLIAFLLSGAVATPILGRVGDMMGKVRTLLLALSAMIVGNLISGFAPNIEILVIGRAMQGVGMAAFPLSYGIIRDEFARDQMASAVGTMSSVIAVGGGFGAVLAGPIVSMLGWRWLFWLPTIAMVIIAVLAGRFIPESPTRTGGRVNWIAATLLASWLVALLLPLSQGTQWGWTSPQVLGSLGVAAVLIVAWVVFEIRSANPLIDMRLMRQPAVWTTNLVALLFGATMFSVWAFVPQLIQVPSEAGYGFGASVSQAGWVILPMLVTMALAGILCGPLQSRISFKSQLSLGAALVAVACAGFAFFHHDIWQLLICSAVFGLGLGFAYSTMTNIIVRSVPANQTGTATGMNANIRTIGGAMGTAIMTAIVTSHGGGPADAAAARSAIYPKAFQFLSYGDRALPGIKDRASAFLQARLGLNATLWALQAAGIEVTSLSSAAAVAEVCELVRAKASAVETTGLREVLADVSERETRTLLCKKGIGSNIMEFARHVLGQRQAANPVLRGYDQGFSLRKRGTSNSSPWVVGLGPVSVLALVHCSLAGTTGPRSVRRLSQHLARYGAIVDYRDIATNDLGHQLRMLGLVLDSPDAESGMLLVPPFPNRQESTT